MNDAFTGQTVDLLQKLIRSQCVALSVRPFR